MTGTQAVSSVQETGYVKKVEGVKGIKNDAIQFGQIMSQSLGDLAGNNASLSTAGQNTSNKTSGVDAFSIQTKTANQVSDNSSVKTQTDSSVKDTTAAQKVKTDEKVTPAKAEEKLRTEIKEELDVTDEEIDAVLASLGMNILDLLNSDNMLEFVVEITGVDSPIEILTDSDLSNALFALQRVSEDIKGQLDSVMETFAPAAEDDAVISGVKQETEEEVTDDSLYDDTQAKEDESVKITVTDNRTEKKTDENNSQSAHHEDSFDNSKSHDTILSNLNQAVNAAVNTGDVSELSQYTSVTIINQIVDAARVTLNNQVSSMELLLNPDNLGKISLNVSVRDGVVTAQIAAETQTAKEAIESQVIMLKEQLNNQGLKVEAVEVTLASHSFEAGYESEGSSQEASSQTSKKKSGIINIDSDDELIQDAPEDDRMVADVTANLGGLVNYKA